VTLNLTSDDLECLIDLNKYHYLVCGCIVFDCTYGRTFLPGLLGHLSRDDLKTQVILTKIPRNPDDTEKTRSSGKNAATEGVQMDLKRVD